MSLNALEIDAIVELLNHGVGRAADALSKMVGEEVLITVPVLELVDFNQFEQQLNSFPSDEVMILLQPFAGEFDGTGMWILSQESCHALTGKVLSKTKIDPASKGVEDDLLTEVGNIVLNACVGQLAEMVESPLRCSVPQLKSSSAEALIPLIIKEVDHFSEQQSILMLHLNFSLASLSMQSVIGLVLDELAQEELVQKVKIYLDSLLKKITSFRE
ncbi:hypothetical protein FLL45_15695 [Aliikangiella marina]|uniref:Chemotaxis protein CheC n=1 Tax=Aliikangiella marina TaxID=1712262 RepID=A0A545T6Q4_9GAMM|nr:hypothetical protein [Aliikangiella marina]TQV72907.1 hypothetical protein FLL45_15695 [Aliikangiella marina]